MSGVAGGDRISREHIDSTAKNYIDTVLSGFPGFKSADITGSVAAGKKDFGDIDLIVHIEGTDKRSIKKELQNYLENQSVNKILPFRSDKYRGKRSYNAGELVSILYPQTDAGKTAQIDNIIAVTKDESTFKKSFLDWPAEKQGLVLGLVKVAIQEANATRTVDKLFATVGLDVPKTDKVLEFNLSGVELQLRAYTKDNMGKEAKGSREVLWKTTIWPNVDRLLWQYDLTKSFEDILQDAQNTLKHPSSKQRIKGLFSSMVSIKSGEVGTAKAERKQKTIDMVNAMENKKSIYKSLVENEWSRRDYALSGQTDGYKALQNTIPKVLQKDPSIDKQMRLFGLAASGQGKGKKYNLHPDSINKMLSKLDKIAKLRRPDNMGTEVSGAINNALASIDHPDDYKKMGVDLTPDQQMNVIKGTAPGGELTQTKPVWDQNREVEFKKWDADNTKRWDTFAKKWRK